jgi:LysM repeat protein
MANIRDLYTVKRGDTLSKIAERYGTTTTRLCEINGLKNADHIQVNQTIALKAKVVCKVTVLLLDRDRNPILNAKVRLDYDGKRKQLTSGRNGLLPSILTRSPEAHISIAIARGDGTWKLITEISSGWGNKLVTLVSPKMKFTAKTSPHPKDASGMPVRDQQENRTPLTPPDIPATTLAKGKPQAIFGNGKGLKVEQKTDPSGLPSYMVTNDQAELVFLKGYTGEKISESDYRKAAEIIGCEVAVIKAVSEVEASKGFDKRNRPIILYERHVFARCTVPKGKYDSANSDISGLKKPYKQACKGESSSAEVYGNSYPRLAKAYSLDKKAALKACSWGKFQILGENHVAAGFDNVFSYAAAMCRSEKEHLAAFVNFVNSHKALKNAAASKDWASFALFYNGRNYRKFRYHLKMEEAYNKHVQ